jgi:AraC-like DNA-binding protein
MLDRPRRPLIRDMPPAPGDPLGEALHSLRMTGVFYVRSELRAPWALLMPHWEDTLWFHVVVAGRAVLDTGDGLLDLRPGDLLLAPHGRRHVMASEPGLDAVDVTALEHDYENDRYAVLLYGGEGPRTTVVCGAVRFGHPAARALVDLLPPVIHVDAAESPQAEWTQAVVRLMAAEARAVQPGGEAVVTRLADVLVIQAIRSWIASDPSARTGWLGALQDPQIGQALALVHRDPGRPWTIAALAHEVAMSRSAFAARFAALVGEPVVAYLTRWRMQVAATAIADGQATIGELANRLGYRSEAAFARAFKRVIGVPPGAVRATRA